MAEAYDDEERLRRLYCEEGLSAREIADELDCTHPTILTHLDKYDIDRRKADDEKPPNFGTNHQGYERFQHKSQTILHHRLLAVAEYGLDAIDGKDIHHQNHLSWDNRPSNIKPLHPTTHRRLHNLDRSDGEGEWRDEATLRELYKDLTLRDIADELNCDPSIVLYWMKKFGIERRESGGATVEEMNVDRPWHDEEKVRELYHSDLSVAEVAEELGCSTGAIYDSIDRYDIEKREDRRATA